VTVLVWGSKGSHVFARTVTAIGSALVGEVPIARLPVSGAASDSRGVRCPPSMGEIVESPEVGGLHHRYERLAA
jgi:hypothetical protein